MSPVFGHGQLRLYLLKLLDEAPRHGYEIIRLLEDRFYGLYAPSAGTIYPRLQRLEREGLVTVRQEEGGRKTYHITDAGRAEVAARADEVAALETDIRASVRGLAEEIRDEVRGSARDVRAELKQAAREVRRRQRHSGPPTPQPRPDGGCTREDEQAERPRPWGLSWRDVFNSEEFTREMGRLVQDVAASWAAPRPRADRPDAASRQRLAQGPDRARDDDLQGAVGLLWETLRKHAEELTPRQRTAARELLDETLARLTAIVGDPPDRPAI